MNDLLRFSGAVRRDPRIDAWFSGFTDPHQTMMADADSLTAIFSFIPMANQKVAGLRAKVTRGETLTPGQQDYLHRIKEIPSLIKLALVEKTPPPAPTPAPVPPVIVKREPAAEGSPIVATRLSRRSNWLEEAISC